MKAYHLPHCRNSPTYLNFADRKLFVNLSLKLRFFYEAYSDFMADLSTNIRLAVDSGKVAMGVNGVVDSIKQNHAKLVIVAQKNRKDILEDVRHMCKVAGIKVVVYKGDSIQLGAVCGKPFSVSTLSIIEQGHSKILEEN